MIPKHSFLIGLLVITQAVSFAQDKKKVNPKHINYYKVTSAETKEVKAEIVDALSMVAFSKFKLKLSNNTLDYILYKPQESKFKLEVGEFVPQDKKYVVLSPGDKANKVIDAKGNGQNMHVDAYTFVLDGLYKIPSKGQVIEAADFTIPPSTRSFNAGNFKIELLNSEQITGQTGGKFKITYLGEGAGIVEPNKISLKTASGKTIACLNNPKYSVLPKGESDTFIVLYEHEATSGEKLIWNDALIETTMTKIEGTTLGLVIDPLLTK